MLRSLQGDHMMNAQRAFFGDTQPGEAGGAFSAPDKQRLAAGGLRPQDTRL